MCGYTSLEYKRQLGRPGLEDASDAFGQLLGYGSANELILVSKKMAISPTTEVEAFDRLLRNDGGLHSYQRTYFPRGFGEVEENEYRLVSGGVHVLEGAKVLAGRKNLIHSTVADATPLIRGSYLDPLTGLFNRKGMDDSIRRRNAEYERYGEPFSLAMIELNDFKGVNDNNGHLAGDEVLRRVSGGIVEHIRSTDIPCRYGGDEFLIVLPHTKSSESTVGPIYSRISEVVRGLPEELKIRAPRFGIQLVSASPKSGESLDHLFQRVDDEVYRLKSKGRCGFTALR